MQTNRVVLDWNAKITLNFFVHVGSGEKWIAITFHGDLRSDIFIVDYFMCGGFKRVAYTA